MKVTRSEVQFEANGKPVSFAIIHNLPNVRGLSFDDALNGLGLGEVAEHKTSLELQMFKLR